MYAATCALNGLTVFGRVSGNWGVHDIGHVLSLMYDTPHGATHSIAYPAWLRLMNDRIPQRILEFGKVIFNTSTAENTISALDNFFSSIETPVRMNEIGIGEDKKPEIVDMMVKNKVNGAHYKLSKEDIEKVVELMY